MKFLTLTGRERDVSISQYLVDWDAGSLSNFQKQVKDFLRPYLEKTKVVCEEFPVPGTRMSIDIVNITDRYVVECQGVQHLQYNEWMHDNSEANFRSQLKRDLRKEEWATKNGLIFIEIFETDMPLTAEWFKTKYNIDL